MKIFSGQNFCPNSFFIIIIAFVQCWHLILKTIPGHRTKLVFHWNYFPVRVVVHYFAIHSLYYFQDLVFCTIMSLKHLQDIALFAQYRLGNTSKIFVQLWLFVSISVVAPNEQYQLVIGIKYICSRLVFLFFF